MEKQGLGHRDTLVSPAISGQRGWGRRWEAMEAWSTSDSEGAQTHRFVGGEGQGELKVELGQAAVLEFARSSDGLGTAERHALEEIRPFAQTESTPCRLRA